MKYEWEKLPVNLNLEACIVDVDHSNLDLILQPKVAPTQRLRARVYSGYEKLSDKHRAWARAREIYDDFCTAGNGTRRYLRTPMQTFLCWMGEDGVLQIAIAADAEMARKWITDVYWGAVTPTAGMLSELAA